MGRHDAILMEPESAANAATSAAAGTFSRCHTHDFSTMTEICVSGIMRAIMGE